MPTGSTKARALRELIDDFLGERLEAKLKGLKADAPEYKRDELRQQYRRESWIANAARRVSQLQVVTHAIKATHPDAKGSNLYAPPSTLPSHPLVGSHLLGEAFETDVVGNAAALDVYKFLKLEHDGKTLLERAREHDLALAEAFTEDRAEGEEWLRAFARITEPPDRLTSHAWAKQCYWLVGEDPKKDSEYHLLAPLYSTILAHELYQRVSADRFSEEAKAARKARRDGGYSEIGYRDYPHIAIQKFGGSQPQNISQLNSERGGYNYLLASLPPNWHAQGIRPPLHVNSVFRRFERRKSVREQVYALHRLLESEPRPNIKTRKRRDRLVAAIVDELIQLAAEIATLEPGWSADPACDLPAAEAFWLDAGRAEIDLEFAERRTHSEWPAEVCHRFANWLNGQLERALPVGDVEHDYWEKHLREQMDELEEVLPHV